MFEKTLNININFANSLIIKGRKKFSGKCSKINLNAVFYSGNTKYMKKMNKCLSCFGG